jgi:hypothetical protein
LSAKPESGYQKTSLSGALGLPDDTEADPIGKLAGANNRDKPRENYPPPRLFISCGIAKIPQLGPSSTAFSIF